MALIAACCDASVPLKEHDAAQENKWKWRGITPRGCSPEHGGGQQGAGGRFGRSLGRGEGKGLLPGEIPCSLGKGPAEIPALPGRMKAFLISAPHQLRSVSPPPWLWPERAEGPDVPGDNGAAGVPGEEKNRKKWDPFGKLTFCKSYACALGHRYDNSTCVFSVPFVPLCFEVCSTH